MAADLVALPEIITCGIAVCSAVFAWVFSDARSKVELTQLEAKLSQLEKWSTTSSEKSVAFEVSMARCEQDRAEIHKGIDRLDSQKASKETVDGFRSEIFNLRSDMDKRFDRIERLLEHDRADSQGSS